MYAVKFKRRTLNNTLYVVGNSDIPL